jgi:hypothetical protein
MAELRRAAIGEYTLKIFSKRLAAEAGEDPKSLEFIEKAIATIADRPRRDGESAFPDMGTILEETMRAKRGIPADVTTEQYEQQQADEAFGWAMSYLRNHGVDGRVKLGRLLEHQDGDQSPNPKFAPNTPAPEIPTPIASALTAIGGTVRQGLERLNLATASETSFIKREFTQAFSRARRAE